MRGLLLASVVLLLVGVASAQSPTSYSDGLPLLKRRPFKPEPSAQSSCSAPHLIPEALGGFSPPRVLVSRGPIYSPYSMIRYGTTTSPAGSEALPPPASPTEPKQSEPTTIPVEPAPAPRREYLPGENETARPSSEPRREGD